MCSFESVLQRMDVLIITQLCHSSPFNTHDITALFKIIFKKTDVIYVLHCDSLHCLYG